MIETKTEIEKTIEKYAKRTEQLDTILQTLTKDFCAKNCPNRPYGCCGENYSAGIPEEMLLLQEKEAKENGWIQENTSTNLQCKYHAAEEGCKLKLYKPPVCMGFLCGDLRHDIDKRYSRDGENFNELMYRFRFLRLDLGSYESEKLLSYLDAAIESGNKIVVLQNNKAF